MNENIEKLLNHSLEYAKDLLLETGEAYPFGAFMDTIDNVHPLEMEVDKKKTPTIGQVIENLEKYCKEEMAQKRMNGYCLAYEVQMNLSEEAEPTDAIAFEIHYIDETELPNFYLPFSVGEDKKVVLDEPFAVKS